MDITILLRFKCSCGTLRMLRLAKARQELPRSPISRIRYRLVLLRHDCLLSKARLLICKLNSDCSMLIYSKNRLASVD